MSVLNRCRAGSVSDRRLSRTSGRIIFHQGLMFQRILIANRGEIALRVIRACKDLGIETVAVYSEADRGAPYLAFADQAVCIGPAAGGGELSQDSPPHRRRRGRRNVEAIHPGYGFLSENAQFAEVCRDCNIEFIGPPQEAMDRLGNKNQARKLAQASGGPRRPRQRRSDHARGRRPQARTRNRLSRPDQGGRRRRRPRHARGPRRHQPERTVSSPPARRPKKPSRTAASIWKNTSNSHATSRCKSSATSTATSSISGSATVRSQRRHQKLVEESPAPNLPDAVRRCDVRGRRAPHQNRRLPKRRHLRVPGGQATIASTSSRSTPAFRSNIRSRSWSPASIWSRNKSASPPASRCASSKTTSCHGLRDRMPDQRRRPEQCFRPSPGQITRWEPPGGPGVRLDTHVVHRLSRAAALRFAGRQAPRPPCHTGRGNRLHATGPERIQGRGDSHHDRPASTDPEASALRGRKNGYDVHRARDAEWRIEGIADRLAPRRDRRSTHRHTQYLVQHEEKEIGVRQFVIGKAIDALRREPAFFRVGAANADNPLFDLGAGEVGGRDLVRLARQTEDRETVAQLDPTAAAQIESNGLPLLHPTERLIKQVGRPGRLGRCPK